MLMHIVSDNSFSTTAATGAAVVSCIRVLLGVTNSRYRVWWYGFFDVPIVMTGSFLNIKWHV